jgi:hypothetical protein
VKRVFVIVVMALKKNHLLSCHIVIHKRTYCEETLLSMINTFLGVCKSLGMSMERVVLFLCGGEWCELWNCWK